LLSHHHLVCHLTLSLYYCDLLLGIYLAGETINEALSLLWLRRLGRALHLSRCVVLLYRALLDHLHQMRMVHHCYHLFTGERLGSV
jgi:hypothetical protein